MKKIIQFFGTALLSILFFVLSGCMPSISTGYKSLSGLAPQASAPAFQKLMIAQAPTSASSLAGETHSASNIPGYTVHVTSHQFARTEDRHFPAFVRTIEESGVAAAVMESPVPGATILEHMAHARKAGAEYIVISHLESTPNQSGPNAQMGWLIFLSATVIGTVFLGLLNPVTYKGNAVLIIEVWSVSEGIRLYRKSFEGEGYSKGWDTASAKIRHSKSSVSKAVNMAYTRAIPDIIRFLTNFSQ